jgi:hypothetical protein
MGEIATAEILEFMQRLGGRYAGSATLLLLGGSALCLLGNPRRTLDIDYLVEGPLDQVAELEATVDTVAAEMRLEVEVVPLGEFIPLPDGAESRHRHVGQFGGLTVCVFDPYSIALSKVDPAALRPTCRTSSFWPGKGSSTWSSWKHTWLLPCLTQPNSTSSRPTCGSIWKPFVI